MKYTIATGNIVDGFKLFGIFDSELEAVEHATGSRDFDHADWSIIPIEGHHAITRLETRK